MEKLRFSIIIPTRDRVDTLKYTLLTCIEQRKFDNYEILVSNNGCTDNTEKMVKSLKCDKIRYIKTDRPLPMHESFEFALNNSRGEYKIILGSDDGLTLHCLYVLDKIISTTNEEVFNWKEFNYNWPDIEEMSNKLYIDSFKCNTKIIDGVKLVKDIINFKSEKFSPTLYRHATISEKIVQGLKEKNGRIYKYGVPDIYSGMSIASYKKKFLSLGIKLTIEGMSYMSSGRNPQKEGLKSKVLNYNKDAKAMNIFPRVPTYSSAVDGSFNQIKIDYPELYDGIKLNYQKIIENAINELIEVSELEYFLFILNYMYDVLKNDKTLKNDKVLQLWFKENYIDKYSSKEIIEKEMKAIKARTGKIHFTDYEGIVMEGNSIGFTNIYEVALLIEKYFYNDTFIEEYLEQFEYSWNKSKNVMEKIGENARGKNIGIYGLGSHSEILLELYKYFNNEIDFNIIFFDSNSSKWGSTFMGYEVHSPNEIPNLNLEKIVISSKTYQEEIYELIKRYESKIEIVKLYEVGDYFYLNLV